METPEDLVEINEEDVTLPSVDKPKTSSTKPPSSIIPLGRSRRRLYNLWMYFKSGKIRLMRVTQ